MSSNRHRLLRGSGAVLLVALACGGGYQAWQQSLTLLFEQSVLALEVSNRQRLPEVLLTEGAQVPAPGVAANSAVRMELRARWWLLWSERVATAGERRELLRRARDELRAAVARRPEAAFAWSALAAVKAQMGSFDGEFSKAFDAALQRAPHELRVQRQLLGIVLRYPERLGTLKQPQGRALLARFDRRDPYLLLRLASRYHALPWVCAEAELGVIARRHCAQSGYPTHTNALQ